MKGHGSKFTRKKEAAISRENTYRYASISSGEGRDLICQRNIRVQSD